ncbi:MAG TPA: helix-turn-helix domain-containing protein [Candidatus Limnocylindrales bacterium]|nr:helix-turn-helix domain-containing protein [Candidatus Limnocylindrales bacterium]
MNVTSAAASAPARSRLATRERLLESATRLFAQRGLHRVTTHDIARDAGVAAGTFYLHFKDKSDVYRHILFTAIEDLRAAVIAAVSNAATQRDALRARAEVIVGFAETNRDLVRILFSHDSETAAIEADVLTHLAAGLEARFRREMTQGIFPSDLDPAATAQALVGMTARLIDWWTEDPKRAPREQILHTIVRLQMNGIRSDDHAGEDRQE